MSTAAAFDLDLRDEQASAATLTGYLEMLSLVERLHRMLLDVIKVEFERAGRLELNPVQALLLFNIGTRTVSAGELKSRGYYLGSNVSYNLKKMVEAGFIDHQRSEIDRRTVRISLTEAGLEVHRLIADLLARHAGELDERAGFPLPRMVRVTADLRELEGYWRDSMRYLP